jgi:exonuclease SbcC
MAIGWAMFDSLPCKKADFIHRGAKEAWAKVTFEHAGEEYWVGRSTKDGASLRKENGQVLAMGTRDTYSHLSALLGLNGDLSSLYRDALAPPQGQLTAGFSLSPAARQDFWGPVLGLEKYRKAYGQLREPLKVLEGQLQGATREVIAAKGFLDQVQVDGNVETIREELDRLVTDQAARYNRRIELDASLKEARDARADALLVEELQGRKETYKKSLAGLQAPPEWKSIEAQVITLRAQVDLEVGRDLRKLLDNQAREDAVRANLEERTIPSAQAETERLGKELIGAQEATGQMEGLNWKLAALEAAETKAFGGLAQAQEIVRAAGNLEGVLGEEGECPVCKTELDAQARAEIQARLVKEIEEGKATLANAQAQVSSLRKQILQVRNDRMAAEVKSAKGKDLVEAIKRNAALLEAHHGALSRAKQELAVAQLDIERLSTREEAQVAIREELTRMEKDLALTQQRAQEITSRRDLIQQDLDDIDVRLAGIHIPETVGDIPTMEIEHSQLEKQILEVSIQQERKEAELDLACQVLEMAAKIEIAQEQERTIKAKYDLLSECRQAISDAGPLVAESVMSSLSTLAGAYWLAMDKTTTLEWKGDYGLRSDGHEYNMLSGGAQVAAALAARLAVASAMSNDLGWVILDEPSVHLDSSVKEALAEVLSGLGLDQMIVVSHDHLFHSCASQVIELGSAGL